MRPILTCTKKDISLQYQLESCIIISNQSALTRRHLIPAGIAVARSTPGADSDVAATEEATPAAPKEPLSTEALPGAVEVQYTDEVSR